MKRVYKRTAAVFLAIAMLLSISTISMGQYQTPSYLRVGLYYKDASVNTALSVFNVSAAAGIQAGYFLNNTFVEIYREASNATLYVRKDTDYYNAGNTLKEYNPSSTPADSIAAFQKYGPFHIKIGSDFPDQATAAAQALAYRQAGVPAYVAYNDLWQVWTGSYPDEASARTDVAAITPLLGEAGYTVIPPASNRIVLTNAQYQPLCIFGSNTAFFQLRPTPENNPPVISIKDKPYRGALEVRRLAASDMTVINYLSMQEYLYGNVPPEIGGRSPAEAIKAQALASKMYAINNIGKHSKTGFDLCPTTSCQVYKGYGSEVAQANAAIDQVKDLVVTYNGKLAGAIYYFASSGGRTEDVRNVWGSSYPYLVSVEDKYEKIYSWTKTLRASDIKTKLPQLGNILGVSITQTAESGRVTQLAVRGDSRNDPALYIREQCRTLFGLDSQLYTITTDADVYTAPFSHIPASVALRPNSPAAVATVQNMVPTVSAPLLAEKGGSSDTATQTAAVSQAANPAQTQVQNLSAVTSPTSASVQTLSSDPTSGNGAGPAVFADASGNPLNSAQQPLTQTLSSSGQTTDDPANGLPSGSQTTPGSIEAPGGSNASTVTGAGVTAPIPLKLSIPLPVASSPAKTQLGGKQVATANGITTLRTSNNKFTILGADGAVRTATLVPETYTFSGKGWGHAVGMSQEGAIGMGRSGISFDQILQHYFQGTRIEPG